MKETVLTMILVLITVFSLTGCETEATKRKKLEAFIEEEQRARHETANWMRRVSYNNPVPEEVSQATTEAENVQ